MTNHFTSQALQRAATAGERVVESLVSVASLIEASAVPMGVVPMGVVPMGAVPMGSTGVVDSWVGKPCYFADPSGLTVNFGNRSQREHCHSKHRHWPQFLRDRLS